MVECPFCFVVGLTEIEQRCCTTKVWVNCATWFLRIACTFLIAIAAFCVTFLHFSPYDSPPVFGVPVIVVLLIICFTVPCCFCCKEPKDHKHTCGSCNKHIATAKLMRIVERVPVAVVGTVLPAH